MGIRRRFRLKNDEFLIQSDGERGRSRFPASFDRQRKALGQEPDWDERPKVDQDVSAPSSTSSVFSATYADSLKAYPGNVLAAKRLISFPRLSR
jgi:hypothetical protein